MNKSDIQAKTLLVSACLMLVMLTGLGSTPVQAKSAAEIDIEVTETINRFKREVKGGSKFLQRASGMLVFPSVIKAGFVVGGEYGEGALRVGNKTVDYYNTAAASLGFRGGQRLDVEMPVYIVAADCRH